MIEADEGAISVAAPGTTLSDWRAREGRRPNPHLDSLLRRLEIWKGPMLDLRTIQQELRRVGLPALSVEEQADKVVLGLRASVELVAAARALDLWREDDGGLVASTAVEDRAAKKSKALKALPASGSHGGVAAVQPRPRASDGLAMPSLTPVPVVVRPTIPVPTRTGRHAVQAARSRPPSRFSAEARATQLLDLLHAEPDALTRHQIEHTLSWSRSTTRAVLASMVADGRVALEATSPRSPHQRYRVA